MPEALTGVVLQYGFPGVCILVLAYAYYRKDKRCDDLADKTGAQLEKSTTALNRLCDMLRIKPEA